MEPPLPPPAPQLLADEMRSTALLLAGVLGVVAAFAGAMFLLTRFGG